MVQTGTGCVQIIHTKPGERTGETLYLTEDGRLWTSEHTLGENSQSTSTGTTIGYVHGDKMCGHP